MNIEELKVGSEIIKALKGMGFETLTPIQEKTIPVMLEGKDIIAQAPTGTGKTCAYAIPAIDNIDTDCDDVQVLVMCPTRELTVQSVEEIRKVCAHKDGVRALAIYGGQSINRQILDLKKRPQIVVGTPGRIIDHIGRHTLKLANLRLLVLDEADEMLNMGFREDITEILKSVSSEHQTVLFSATMPAPIKEISKKYQRSDVAFIKTTRDNEEKQLIKQYYIRLKENQKYDVLSRLLDSLSYRLVLVFCRTKKRVDELTDYLQETGYESEALHGDLKQAQRTKVMGQFKKGVINILVATDVAARGLDIENVDLVINFDLTDVDEYYLHRIGRTGRAKKEGEAYTFLTKNQHSMIKVYEQLTKDKMIEFTPPSGEVCKTRRQAQYFNNIKPALTEKDLDTYKELVYAFASENAVDVIDVAAALLRFATYKEVKETVKKDNENIKRVTGAGVKRFFINLGTKDELTNRGLQTLICEFVGIKKEDFLDTYMKDSYSFFELPENFADEVIKQVDGQFFNDRQIAVEVADKTDKDSNKGKPSRKPRSQGSESSYFKERDNKSGFGSFNRGGERGSSNRGERRTSSYFDKPKEGKSFGENDKRRDTRSFRDSSKNREPRNFSRSDKRSEGSRGSDRSSKSRQAGNERSGERKRNRY